MAVRPSVLDSSESGALSFFRGILHCDSVRLFPQEWSLLTIHSCWTEASLKPAAFVRTHSETAYWQEFHDT
jgi:hypothetical protein